MEGRPTLTLSKAYRDAKTRAHNEAVSDALKNARLAVIRRYAKENAK